MKKLNKLLMLLILAAFVSACGSDGELSEADARAQFNSFNNNNGNASCVSNCVGTKTLSTYRAEVASLLFTPNFDDNNFIYERYTVETDLTNVLGIFTFSFPDFGVTTFRRGPDISPIHEEGVNSSQIRDFLLSLIDSANQFAPVNNQVFDIRVGNDFVGAIYRIDLGLPIEANPTHKVGTNDSYELKGVNNP